MVVKPRHVAMQRCPFCARTISLRSYLSLRRTVYRCPRCGLESRPRYWRAALVHGIVTVVGVPGGLVLVQAAGLWSLPVCALVLGFLGVFSQMLFCPLAPVHEEGSVWSPGGRKRLANDPERATAQRAILAAAACVVVAGCAVAAATDAMIGVVVALCAFAYAGSWLLMQRSLVGRKAGPAKAAGPVRQRSGMMPFILGVCSIGLTVASIVCIVFLFERSGQVVDWALAMLMVLSFLVLLVGLVVGIVELAGHRLVRRVRAAWGTALSTLALVTWVTIGTVGVLAG